MNTTASLDRSMLKRNSLLFWCALVAPVGIIVIGINFILNPVGASTAFGIPIHDPAAFPFMWVKGIRDIFSGLVILSFLWRGDRGTTAILSALAILIPVGDGLVILSHLGFAPPIYIHWGTALYMIRCCVSFEKEGRLTYFTSAWREPIAPRTARPNQSRVSQHGERPTVG